MCETRAQVEIPKLPSVVGHGSGPDAPIDATSGVAWNTVESEQLRLWNIYILTPCSVPPFKA